MPDVPSSASALRRRAAGGRPTPACFGQVATTWTERTGVHWPSRIDHMATTTMSQTAPAAAEQSSARSTAPARTGAEAILQLLVASGVDYVFLNPGTDTAPIQEALVALAADGERIPTLVPCLFENVAMAAAHGYFLVTRRPQLVVVH